jgi:hypothetical protein
MRMDNGSSGALDNDDMEDNNDGPRFGWPSPIDDKDNQVGGVIGVDDDRMGCTTALTSTSTSATTASGQEGRGY